MGSVKTIAVDFDGVIADYSKGWQGEEVFGDPIHLAREALQKFHDLGYKIIIFTTRKPTPGFLHYLWENEIPFDAINTNIWIETSNETSGKVIADLYIDDRGLRFEGNWTETFEKAIELLGGGN